jgi:hypothetical protein
VVMDVDGTRRVDHGASPVYLTGAVTPLRS